MPTSQGSAYNEVISRTREALLYSLRISAVNLLSRAIANGAATMANDAQLRQMLEDLQLERVPRSLRLEMWQGIGQSAQTSLIAAYASRKYKRPVASYRVGDRYSGGVLRDALKSPTMVEATAFGLNFVNRETLDKAAHQWRRLNFGAGGGGQEGDLTPPGKFEVTGLGIAIGLEPDTRPAFGMPAGFWLGSKGGQWNSGTEVAGVHGFYPTRKPIKFSTRGIAARNFLDAPLALVATRIKPGFDDLFTKFRANQRKSVTKTITGS